MSYIYKNITGSTATEIKLESRYSYPSVLLCNIHSTDEVLVDLYIQRSEITGTVDTIFKTDENGTKYYEDRLNTELHRPKKGQDDGRKIDGSYNEVERTTYTYYILKSLVMPVKSTLVLDEEEFKHDIGKYRLYIKLDQSDSAVDVKIIQGEMLKGLSSGGSGITSSGGY